MFPTARSYRKNYQTYIDILRLWKGWTRTGLSRTRDVHRKIKKQIYNKFNIKKIQKHTQKKNTKKYIKCINTDYCEIEHKSVQNQLPGCHFVRQKAIAKPGSFPNLQNVHNYKLETLPYKTVKTSVFDQISIFSLGFHRILMHMFSNFDEGKDDWNLPNFKQV